jgi:hypothetical protein
MSGAIGAVDVQPQAVSGTQVGDRGEVVDGTGVRGSDQQTHHDEDDDETDHRGLPGESPPRPLPGRVPVHQLRVVPRPATQRKY